ncbi:MULTISPECIES: DUF3352 domain-containing protein [unclassified Cyanobium]|uniref:DUF3352 domain-containing protein n=1 Tax=unclassified Cyanobium TaxID=2627006 RepID=UPI0020CDD2E3|nr:MULTISPECIES: DUF3352 domain-containing protein [unclassified Cyanobium]MCP9858703.1 DUF3352 domain-containing protein [Cyanobium sp. Cruz-8H5]MCP9865914.1 DUF3352 domain-containing protein [Cyanobium sp. Cruz-8D1]
MKARPFLAVLLALVLVVFGLGLGGWWLVWQRSALRLQRLPLVVPRAAQFVPRDAPLSFHLFSDGDQPLDYARAVAPPRQRRQAAEAVGRLRDGAFAAAGLDYDSELRSWLAAPVGLALFEADSAIAAGGSRGGWLLALGSRDDDGARLFLQRFWQTRSLAGTDLQISTYRGMGLISGKGALLGRTPMPLATALVDDDLVLIASGRGVLEQALDVSQIPELNQAGQASFQEGLRRLGTGAALLQAAPGALERWLGLPLPAPADQRPGALLLALRPEGPSLRLSALLGLPPEIALPEVGADAGLGQALLAALHRPASSLALVQDPASLAMIPLLRPLLARLVGAADAAGPVPALVVGSDGGPLLAAASGDRWLLGTAADRPDPSVLEAALAVDGLIAAPLEVDGHPLLAWTRLQAVPGRRDGRSERSEQLQAPLLGWRWQRGEQAWWGESLGQLESLDGPEAKGAGRLQGQLEALAVPEAPLQWALDGPRAREVLASWRPWQRLTALAGGPLSEPVTGLALALGGEPGVLVLEARLDFGGS